MDYEGLILRSAVKEVIPMIAALGLGGLFQVQYR